jgi:NADPH-dependent glutamate synthase beta subunit-like oxidoreductase
MTNPTNVYDIDRIAPIDAPPEFADDVADVNFVPAPCQVACPIGTDAPSYIAYIWEGKIEQAFEAITATNPFSSICGRVCDAPCEPACRRADSDGPLAIRNLKRFVMEKLGKSHHLPPVPVTRKETVGIVGSGPAGMTAAQDLAEAGFEVHVYEMMDRLGGMMTWGIPAFRLPPGIIEEDMQRILKRCSGIKAHVNCALGKDITLDELKARHDAVLLTIGSWWGKSMGIPGDDHPQVVDGVGFLRRVNDGERPSLPETVLVIGGGDVAMDACRVAKRLPGCKNVQVIYRRGPNEIPARKDELHGAIKEGIEFVYNTQPVRVVAEGNRFALRCVETALGEPGMDGRRRPVEVPGSERDIDCGMVIMAVGQKGASEELDKHGLIDVDRVRTDWKSMRTKDPKVFAAGDGAFGGSTIVKAMFHGHRAAYYVKSFLNDVADPLPYRTPYRTRRVPVAQDINWEVFPRQEQAFHGLGENPVAFPEIESTYDEKTAKDEAARCYRCDAETGSHDYSVRTREDIFVMARTRPDDAVTQKAIFGKRLEQRPNPYPEGHKPSLDDLVFLAANLSRLVIDPYRDACNMTSTLGERVKLELPFLASGFDDVSSELRSALGQALAKAGSGYIGRVRLPGDAPWLQLVVAGRNHPDPTAAGHIHVMPDGFKPFAVQRTDGKLTGLAVRASELQAAIPFALDKGFDMLLLDATPGIARPWSELAAPPDFTVMRDAIRILRRLNREEDLELLFFGGVRSGTDGAKLVSLGANAAVIGVAMALALGGEIIGHDIRFYGDRSEADRIDAAASILQALSAEASIMARCTGKTDVHNLEPEDLRSITIPTAEATGIPLAGARKGPAAAIAATGSD